MTAPPNGRLADRMATGLWRKAPLSDPAVVAMALAAGAGALVPLAVPVVVALVAVAGALVWGRALLLVAAVALLAAGLSHQAWSGLTPLPPGPFAGTVTLVSDPTSSFGGWKVDARTSVGRVELLASGGAGGRLSSRQAGERVEVTGRIERLSDPTWAVPRHVRARLVAERIVPVDDGGPLMGAVNGIRGLVVRGADSLPADQRALFLGFVLGDDRGASVLVADDFDGAGLSHLLVVSGQNVAFVLAVATPALSRLRLRGRLVATLGVILLFAAVTRFEPSVLRAATMAAIGATAVAVGRPVSGVRVVALAVTGLLLVDPLLVHSVGFRLSTAAALGIVVLARPLARALPGPGWLSLPLAVTLAAQAAVAPLLVPAFGPMPVAAVPANLLAEPVAGLVMMWGCTAGLVAGLVPSPLAAVLHWPTRAGLWWVAGVARTGAGLPLGTVGLGAVSAAAACLVVAVLAHGRRSHRRRSRLGPVAAVLAAVLLLGAGLQSTRPTPGRTDVGGAELWRGDGPGAATVLVVPGNARADGVLAGLRRAGVDRVDLVVLRSPGPAAAGVLAVVRQRVVVTAVWAPEGSPAADATSAPSGPVEAGGLSVSSTRDGERLAVDVEVLGRGG
ncbi:MAG TPA: ComEC/Rec2 family competence protein [Acidimicrobiales bacterium]